MRSAWEKPCLSVGLWDVGREEEAMGRSIRQVHQLATLSLLDRDSAKRGLLCVARQVRRISWCEQCTPAKTFRLMGSSSARTRSWWSGDMLCLSWMQCNISGNIVFDVQVESAIELQEG